MDKTYERFLLQVKLASSGRLASDIPTPEYQVIGEGLVVGWPCATVEEWLEKYGGETPTEI